MLLGVSWVSDGTQTECAPGQGLVRRLGETRRRGLPPGAPMQAARSCRGWAAVYHRRGVRAESAPAGPQQAVRRRCLISNVLIEEDRIPVGIQEDETRWPGGTWVDLGEHLEALVLELAL